MADSDSDLEDRRRRLGQVERDVAEIRGQIAEMHPQIELAIAGVTNFRKHAERANQYFDRAEGALDAEDKRRANWWVKAGVIAVILAAVLIVPIQRGWRLVSDVVKLTDDWKQYYASPPINPSVPGAPVPSAPDSRSPKQKSYFDHHKAGAKFDQQTLKEAEMPTTYVPQ